SALSGVFSLNFHGTATPTRSVTDPTLAADLAQDLSALPTTASSATIPGASTPASGPIVIQTPSTANLLTGEQVTVTGVQGNTAANGTWTITVIDGHHFRLNSSTPNGTFVAGLGADWFLAGTVTVSQGFGTNS